MQSHLDVWALSMDAAEEIEQVYQQDYGWPGDVAFRLSGVIVMALVVFAITGWISAVVWCGGYMALQGAQYLHFQTMQAKQARLWDVGVAALISIVTLAHLIWMPWLLLIEGDPVGHVCGATMLAGILIWQGQRCPESLVLVMGSAAVVMGASLVALITTLSAKPEMPQALAVTVCILGLGAFCAVSLFAGRVLHLRRAAAMVDAENAQRLQALGRLTGGVAHDFNNMLTATVGNLELYSEVHSASERDCCVREALLAAERGCALARKLLEFGRQSADMHGKADLAAVLATLETISRRLLPENIDLSITGPEATCVLSLDEHDLTHAVLNLMLNARDSLPGGGRIAVSAHPEDLAAGAIMPDGRVIEPGRYLCMEVSDTGSGIPKETMQHVLKPFYTTKPDGKGTGLGLPMAAEFARKSGGGLTIKTSASGTRVCLFLGLGPGAASA